MKMYKILGVISAVVLLSSQALAAKYGIIDMQAVIMNVAEGKAARVD
jgi:hypothetical protein